MCRRKSLLPSWTSHVRAWVNVFLDVTCAYLMFSWTSRLCTCKFWAILDVVRAYFVLSLSQRDELRELCLVSSQTLRVPAL